MKRNNLILIIVVGVLLIINIFFGYMLFFHKTGPNSQGFQNMHLTDEQIASVTSFFENTTDTTAINSYCEKNRMECFYYCKNINSGNEFCSQLTQGMQNSPPSQ
jgi:hypothetical protein